MKYEDALQLLVNSDRTELERADNLIKSMSRLAVDLLDYRFAVEHYDGNPNNTLVQDTLSKIINNLSSVKGDMDIFMVKMNVADDVERMAENRVVKIAIKVRRKYKGSN